MLKRLLGNKGKDLENLFFTSFELTKQGDLKSPYISRLIFSAFMHLSVLISILMITYNFNQGWGVFYLIFSFIVLIPFSFFYHIKKRALLSWLSYAAVTQQDTSLKNAKIQIAKISWSLRMMALVELMISSRSQENDPKAGVFNMLKEAFMKMIETVLDVAGNYLLPTMVIEQVSIKDAVPKLTQMKTNIPASLAGAFGIDLIGEAISSFSLLIYLGLIGVGCGSSFILGNFVPEALQTQFNGINLFLAPGIVSIFLCIFIGNFIKISASSLKAIYFSIFYTSINRPQEIHDTFRDKVTNYLNFADESLVDSLKSDVKKILPHTARTIQKMSEKPLMDTVPKNYKLKPEKAQKVQEYIYQLRKKGTSEQEIQNMLISKGWPEELVVQLLKENKKAV